MESNHVKKPIKQVVSVLSKQENVEITHLLGVTNSPKQTNKRLTVYHEASQTVEESVVKKRKHKDEDYAIQPVVEQKKQYVGTEGKQLLKNTEEEIEKKNNEPTGFEDLDISALFGMDQIK